MKVSYTFPTGIEIIDGHLVTGKETKSDDYQPTGNPKLDAWHAVRQEWIANGGRVTPELLRLEDIAKKAVDTRYAPGSTSRNPQPS